MRWNKVTVQPFLDVCQRRAERHARARLPHPALAQAEHQVQHGGQLGWDGDGAEHRTPALLQALEGDRRSRHVDALCGERQRFADPAPGPGEQVAEGAHVAGCPVGRGQGGAALVGGA